MEINRRTTAENEFVMLKKVRGTGRGGGSPEGPLRTWLRKRNSHPLGRDDWDSKFPVLFAKSLYAATRIPAFVTLLVHHWLL